MLQRLLIPVLLTGTIAAGVVAELGPSSPAGAGNESTGQSDAVAKAAQASSLTAKAVTAAKAFKSSLSRAQQSALQFAFSSSKKQSGWSNLPTSLVARNGVEVKDLNAAQLVKLGTLLRTIFSSQGYGDEEAVRQADTYLANAQATARRRAAAAPLRAALLRAARLPAAARAARVSSTARASTTSRSTGRRRGRRSGRSSSAAITSRST